MQKGRTRAAESIQDRVLCQFGSRIDRPSLWILLGSKDHVLQNSSVGRSVDIPSNREISMAEGGHPTTIVGRLPLSVGLFYRILSDEYAWIGHADWQKSRVRFTFYSPPAIPLYPRRSQLRCSLAPVGRENNSFMPARRIIQLASSVSRAFQTQCRLESSNIGKSGRWVSR